MIKLFRHFRFQLFSSENKITRYLLYAVGEILLVVIGILIALQVNNRNEARKDHLFEIKMLKEVKEAIQSDQQHYLEMTEKMKALRESAYFFVDYLAEGKEMHDTLFNKFFALNSGIIIQTNEGPYSAIKAVGLDKISNDSLRNHLIRFYDFDYPRFIELLEHYDRNSVRDIDQVISFLDDPYLFKRDGQNLLAQDFDKGILLDHQFHRVLRSILFRTNSLIRVINNFTPSMENLAHRIEKEIEP